MDFENEKKTEETPKDGFQNEQREFRPGRSPRPRIHTGQRPAYERPTYNHDNDEGGFRPEGFGAGLQSSTPQRP
ncbi:MAG: pseudouridine synthase, partial [Prevotella sp.]|nr:pseudouridine synthase [Prevotella sp.]